MDASTERIVRYLSDLNVPINVATVKHFRDKDGREMLAQVYLIEPEVAEERARSASKRRGVTLELLQDEAERNDIGDMFRLMREGTRDDFLARPYYEKVWYGVRLANVGLRAVLWIWSVPTKYGQDMDFVIHTTRFSEHIGVSREHLLEWLPENTRDEDVRRWAGSSPEERENAQGLGGCFQSVEEVERFLAGLSRARSATSLSQTSSTGS